MFGPLLVHQLYSMVMKHVISESNVENIAITFAITCNTRLTSFYSLFQYFDFFRYQKMWSFKGKENEGLIYTTFYEIQIFFRAYL